MLNDPLIHDLPLDAWPGWAQGLFWLWVAVLGSAFGSFLNVVIYRLPRGKSLVHPGSQCPQCGHAIRARDNLPIVGWLLLRGRCRDCDAKISVRYPLVEALVALLFVAVAGLEIGWRAQTLPDLDPALGGVPLWSERRLFGSCAYHLALMLLVLAAAGMRYDGRSLPRWLLAGATTVGFLLPCVWPWLRPVESGLVPSDSTLNRSLIGGLAGAAAGWIVGRLRAGEYRTTPAPQAPDPGLYVAVGVVLGWQALLVIALLTSVVGWLLAVASRGISRLVRFPDEGGLLLAVLILLSGWRWGNELLAGFEVGAWIPATITLLAIAALSVWERRLRLIPPRKTR